MLYQAESEQVYYHILEGSPFLFSDERCKKKMLDIIFDLYRQLGWRLYAFCVTDSVAYFLSVTSRHDFRGEYLQRAADEFLYWCDRNSEVWVGECHHIRARIIRELGSMEEVALHCRSIHRLPLELGYVEQISDYWWSSYITYMENFIWERVDCRAILVYFSGNSETARYRIRKFHTSLNSPTIYITEVQSKNDAKIRLLNENISFS